MSTLNQYPAAELLKYPYLYRGSSMFAELRVRSLAVLKSLNVINAASPNSSPYLFHRAGYERSPASLVTEELEIVTSLEPPPGSVQPYASDMFVRSACQILSDRAACVCESYPPHSLQ